jgi:hypothetical protein
MILLENSNEWNLSPAKKGSSRKKREEQGLKSKRGETSFEKLHVSKKKREDVMRTSLDRVVYGSIPRPTSLLWSTVKSRGPQVRR